MNEPVDDIRIRDFRKSDLHEVLDIARASSVGDSELIDLDVDNMKERLNRIFGAAGRIFLSFSGLFKKEPLKFLVAESDEKLLGTAMISRQGDIGYLSTVFVDPACRREGIAERLTKHALEYIRKGKMRRAVLHVESTNEPAKNLYAKSGFRKFEEVAHYLCSSNLVSEPRNVEDIEIRKLRKEDMDAVHELIKSSEDPKHLEIFGQSGTESTTSIIMRIFRFVTEERAVAVHKNRIVGYSETVSKTAGEVGHIRNIQVSTGMKSKGIEEMLVYYGINAVKKRGVQRVRVMVSLSRPELIMAIERLGFRRYSILEGMIVELV